MSPNPLNTLYSRGRSGISPSHIQERHSHIIELAEGFRRRKIPASYNNPNRKCCFEIFRRGRKESKKESERLTDSVLFFWSDKKESAELRACVPRQQFITSKNCSFPLLSHLPTGCLLASADCWARFFRVTLQERI